ncbi:MAG: hypothetical protein IAE84_02440 [Saprospiraceae bacterium]|nr:hypothetical protein [Saprospiraceae bacterium]HRD81685.1 hypothetical protein [Saprospiraceae bacterium]
MKGSTLLLTLRLLTEEERAALELMAASPLFKLGNRHQDAVELLQYLRPFAPQYESLEMDRQVAAQALFGHRTQPEAELRKAMSNLNTLVRKLILLQQTLTDDDGPDAQLTAVRTDLALMRFCNERLDLSAAKKKSSANVSGRKAKQTDDLVAQTYNSITAKTQCLQTEAAQTFTARQYLEMRNIRLEAAHEWHVHHLFNGSTDVRQLLDIVLELEQLYHYQRLDRQVSLRVSLLGMNTLQEEDSVRAALHYLEVVGSRKPVLPVLSDTPIELELYRQALIMLQSFDAPESTAAFEYLDNQLKNKQLPLPAEQIKGLKAVLRFYCGIMANRRQDGYFLQKRFELFQEHIAEEMLLNRGGVSAVQLCGLLSDALRLGDHNHAWTEDFLQQFENGAQIAHTETPREVYKINKANLLFHQGRFRETANELIGYEWYGRVDNPQILLLAVRIDLKARYELGLYDDDHTLRTIDAAEKRILRLDDLDPQLARMTLFFLRTVRQLAGIRHRMSQPLASGSRRFDAAGKLERLAGAIEEQPIAEKVWLKEQLAAAGSTG